MNTIRYFLTLLLAALLAVSTIGMADDTDIYLTPAAVSRDDSPNVLIIFDNSGSMSDIITTATPYNPATTYTYAGTGTAFDPNKIYWKTSSQSLPSSATTFPGQWFSIANNHCGSSTVPNASNAADTNGTFTVRAASWKTANGWTALNTSDLVVECQADDPADATGRYARKSTGSGGAPATQYTDTSNQALSWTSSMQVTMYSGNYLNYKSNPVTAPQAKIDLAKTVIHNIIDSNPNVRFGLMTFNYDNGDGSSSDNGGRVVFPISTMDSTNRTALHNIVNSLGPDTWTPLSETMYEAYLYLSGQTPLYGNSTNPTNPAKSTAAQSGGKYVSPFGFSCQQAYIIYVTDGDPTWDSHADATIDALPGIGTPTVVDFYAGTYGPSNHKDRLSVLAGWMYDNDLYSGLTGIQRAVTYTIGFNAGAGISTQGLTLLQNTATAGHGKYYTVTNGEELETALQGAIIDIQTTTSSFAAPALSVNAFNRLFNRDDVYFAMFKPSSTTTWEGNVKKFKLNTAGDIIDATGALAIDQATQRIKDTAKSYWSASVDGGTITAGGAGSMIPAPGSRVMYTYTGTFPITSPVDLSASAHLLIDANAAVTATMLGLTGTPTAADRTALINWIRGQDSYDKNLDGLTTDTRWAFSDPLHSRPVAITYGGTNTNPIIKLFVGTNDGAVHMINDKTGVEEWAFIPSHGGAAGGQDMLYNQYNLSQDAYGNHPYGMDGTPTFLIQDNNNNGIIEPENATGKNDKVYMFIGMRRGGKNLYAFDVTPTATLPDASTTGGIVPKLMWVIRGGVDTDYLQLGYTWSRPAVAKIRMECQGVGCNAGDSSINNVLIFGGGYDPHQDSGIPTGPDHVAGPPVQQGMGNTIYIVDPLTGQRLWWASGGPDSASVNPTLTLSGMTYSIPADLTLVDTDADSAIDRIFAADTGGQIWRIDLSPTLKLNTNAGTRGYMFADVACPTGTRPSCTGTARQDRRKFFYPPDYVQVTDANFSLTAEYDALTIASGDREDPLDKQTAGLAVPEEQVHNRVYMFRDSHLGSYAGTTDAFDPTIKEADLYDATADLLQSGSGATYEAQKDILEQRKGWYVSLPKTLTPTVTWEGEKGLAKTNIFAGVVYATTYTPPSTTTAQITCSKDEGLARLYALNLLNGTAVYDYNASGGSPTIEDRKVDLGGGIPSELVIVIRESGVSGLVGTSGGASKPSGIPSGSPRSKTYWYQE